MTEFISWRAAFFVNVPIAIAMIVGSRIVLSETPRQRGRFDVVGALCATAGMGAIIYGIVESAELGWGSLPVIVALVCGAILIAALVFNEARVDQPIMPLRLFRSRERSGAYAARLLYLGAMIGFFYFTTQLMQDGLGFSPVQAGLGFLPMTVVNFVVALGVPKFAKGFSNASLLSAGIAVSLVGMVWLSRVDVGDPYLLAVGLPMLLIGAGQGLAFGPLTTAGVAGVAPGDAGAASGLVNTAHQLGMALGLGILVAVSAGAGAGLDAAAAATRHAAVALTGSSVFLALALVTALAVIVPARRTPNDAGDDRYSQSLSGRAADR